MGDKTVMESGTGIILLTVGGLLILGLVSSYLSPRLHIPRVTLLILCGVALGPSGFDLLPQGHERWYTLFSNIALLMIGTDTMFGAEKRHQLNIGMLEKNIGGGNAVMGNGAWVGDQPTPFPGERRAIVLEQDIDSGAHGCTVLSWRCCRWVAGFFSP